MAKVNHVQRSREEYRCSRCGVTIPKGSAYQHASPGFRARRIVRCLEPLCRFRQSDLTTSLLSGVYAAQEVAEDNLDGWSPEDGLEDLRVWLNECAESAREVAEQYSEAADAMGEAGADHQEKADEIEQWADDLESVDFEDPDEDDEEAPECAHCGEEIGKDSDEAWFHIVSSRAPCDTDGDVEPTTAADPDPQHAKEQAQRKIEAHEDWGQGCRDAYTEALNGLSL